MIDVGQYIKYHTTSVHKAMMLSPIPCELFFSNDNEENFVISNAKLSGTVESDKVHPNFLNL